MAKLRSGILIPTGAEIDRWADDCTAVAAAEGWQMMTIVRCWDDLVKLIRDDRLDIGIVGTAEHLAPDRVPRLVIADEYRQPPTLPGQRRVQWRQTRRQ